MRAKIPEEIWQACIRWVEGQTGLHIGRSRRMDLERALAGAARELAMDPGTLAARFASGQPSPPQIERLIDHLSIGETYFFRDPASFRALEKVVLPDLIRLRAAGSRHLRLWSAACCTGEEAYSMAIVLHRLLPDLAGWDLTVLGTDLNSRFLEKARLGQYGPWSFRNLPEPVRHEAFMRLPSGRFEVLPAIRRVVRFESGNLADPREPIPPLAGEGFDVIFCRNVLMYFSSDRARQAVARLAGSLAPDGWLFPGASEASADLFSGLEAVPMAQTVAYRKGPADPPVAPPEPVRPARRNPSPRPPGRWRRGAAVGPTAGRRPHGEMPRELAGRGCLDEALITGAKARHHDIFDPGYHYLRGVISQEKGDPREAVSALRRALYLDPKLVVAHVALGNLLKRAARRGEAERCFDQARGLLKARRPDEIVAEADGLTAGGMLALLEEMEREEP